MEWGYRSSLSRSLINAIISISLPQLVNLSLPLSEFSPSPETLPIFVFSATNQNMWRDSSFPVDTWWGATSIKADRISGQRVNSIVQPVSLVVLVCFDLIVRLLKQKRCKRSEDEDRFKCHNPCRSGHFGCCWCVTFRWAYSKTVAELLDWNGKLNGSSRVSLWAVCC